jgi:hypothetical protein
MQLTLLERVSGCLLFNSSRLITCTLFTSNPSPSATPLITPPSTLEGGAEVGQRPGFTARTDPAGAPPPGTLPVIYMPDTENISDEEMADQPLTPPRPIPVLETRTVHFTHTLPLHHQPSSPQPGPSRIIQPYHPPSNRLSMPTQTVCAARGRYRSRSVERQSRSKRAAIPSPQRRVVERPEPIPEEDDEEVLILNVTPADTGFLGPILTKPTRKKRR